MEWIRITARGNGAVKEAASLREKKYRDRLGLFPAEGFTLLREAVESGIDPEKVFAAERSEKRVASLFESSSFGGRFYLLPDGVFEKITSEKGSEGVVSLFPARAAKGEPDPENGSFFLVLENLQDPGNVGTVLRTAAALGCDGVYLAGCADPFSPKAIRASMGAVFHQRFQIFSGSGEVFSLLKENKIVSRAMALKKDAALLSEVSFAGKTAFWIGNEGHGLSKETLSQCEGSVLIPMREMESLNAAVAASILLWEKARREKR